MKSDNDDRSWGRRSSQTSHVTTDVAMSVLTKLLSGLYTILIIVIGVVLSLATALRDHPNQDSYYIEAFDVYIYVVSILFLLYVHTFLLRRHQCSTRQEGQRTGVENHIEELKISSSCRISKSLCVLPSLSRQFTNRHDDREITYEAPGVNFYLRLGAIGFGTGSMVQDGFRLAQYIEGGALKFHCLGPLNILSVVLHMTFMFFQTFFIFKSHKIVVHLHKALVQFGFMHLIATNVCVWFATTVAECQEDFEQMAVDSKQSLHHHSHHHHHHHSSDDVMDVVTHATTRALVHNSSGGRWHNYVFDDASCQFTADTSLALKASPYLFPCTIEYSVIAAAILYKMYRNVGRRYPHLQSPAPTRTSSLLDRDDTFRNSEVCVNAVPAAALGLDSWVQNEGEGVIALDAVSVVSHTTKQPIHGRNLTYRTSSINRDVAIHVSANSGVDCDKANKGLFVGLFVTVLTLVAVSCYFVFEDTMPETELSSITFFCTEILLLFALCVGVVLAFVKCQQLSFVPKMAEQVSLGLDSSLLVIALFGVFALECFHLVSALVTVGTGDVISMLAVGTALLAIVEAALQTVFIIDGLQRRADCPQQVTSKPGRALVTFLLLTNLALWIVCIFEVKKADNIPIHRQFYGELPWSIISHLFVPMIIFFRFHSTVCLAEIWVNAYTYSNSYHI